MCGIAGCTGFDDAGVFLIKALKRLEYRGYDSAGMTLCSKSFRTLKVSGKVSCLGDLFLKDKVVASCGIAHTRWATHGLPTAINAHPHLDASERISVVHNGIIENYASLRSELTASGVAFRSETDSEVIPNLIASTYTGNPLASTAQALRRVTGSYGIAVVFEEHPDTIVCARKGSPIVIGLCAGYTLVASDILAIAEYTRDVIYLQDGEIAVLTPEKVDVYAIGDLSPRALNVVQIPSELMSADKGSYAHFMLKEIMEQPDAIMRTMAGRVDLESGSVEFDWEGISRRDLTRISRIVIVGCGSSLHAGLTGEYFFEDLAGIPVSVEQAAEFKCRNPIVETDTLVIAISQSGETADTIAAIREAKAKGSIVISICNVVGSTIARESDAVVYLCAGPEQSVASTKGFTTQVVALLLMAVYLGRGRHFSIEDAQALLTELSSLPQLLRRTLIRSSEIESLARKFTSARDCFYIGRGYLYPTALEGALKLKEISYVHAEGYHAAELKHGPIALLDETVPVVALANQILGQEKTLSNIRECQSRKSPVIAVVSEGDEVCCHDVDLIRVPQCSRYLAPVVTAVALQLFAYYFALAKECPIDQPRNLAKSVTVE